MKSTPEALFCKRTCIGLRNLKNSKLAKPNQSIENSYRIALHTLNGCQRWLIKDIWKRNTIKSSVNQMWQRVSNLLKNIWCDKNMIGRRLFIKGSEIFHHLNLRCDERFTHAFTACNYVLKEISLVGSNQGNYFENATACSKRTLKTTVATQLYFVIYYPYDWKKWLESQITRE